MIGETVDVNFLVTGVGLTAATYSLCRYIYKNKPDLIIQVGIAGCFEANLNINKVVAVEKDCIGDEGVVESGYFHSLFDLRLLEANESPWQNKYLINKHSLIKNCGLKLVNSVTVNEISTSNYRIQYYRDELKVQLESMEGAALHYVCISEGIPFLQIRAISNYAGERNKEKWDLKNSIVRLNEELLRIIKTLKP
jgi:futalosine nucleosidase